MIFRHKKDLHLWNFTYLCKREVKWTLSQTLKDWNLHISTSDE